MSRVTVMTALVLGLVIGVLAGCSGGSGGSVTGSSSVGGGGAGSSTATVQGQLLQSGQSAQGEPIIVLAFRTALGIGLAEAAAGTPLPGATITLTPTGGGTPVSATTGLDGTFSFTSLLPGTYDVSVKVGAVTKPVVSPSPAQITVGAADLGTINGTVFNDTVALNSVDVVATVVSADGILQNDAQLGHAINLAQAAHVSLDQVINLRLKGMGWGQIAHTLGVSPGVIGLGRSNLNDGDLASARDSHGNGKGKGKGKS